MDTQGEAVIFVFQLPRPQKPAEAINEKKHNFNNLFAGLQQNWQHYNQVFIS